MNIKLDEDEHIIESIQKHWFVILSYMIVLLLLSLVPLIFLAVFKIVLPAFDLSKIIAGDPTSLLLFLYSIWLLFLWTVLFFRWTDYYLDVWYVTNKRVIDVEQKGIFRREISTVHYENIEDVTTHISGVIETLLKFGDINIQTSGESREFIIKNATHPDKSKEIILEQYRKVIEKPKPVTVEPPVQS